MEENVKSTNKGAGKTRIRTPIFKKKRREQDQKRKISTPATRLLRTASIHHMQCNDYVLSDDLATIKDTSTVELHPHDIVSSLSGVHLPLMLQGPDGSIPGKQCEACGSANSSHFVDNNQLEELTNFFLKKELLLREELKEVKEALSKQDESLKESGDDVTIRSKDFLHMVELLNANKELFIKVVQDPSSGLPQLTHKRMESEPSTSSEGKLQVECSPSDHSILDEVAHSVKLEDGGAEASREKETDILKKQNNNATVLSRYKYIKHRIKDVIKDNSKELHRISMDGIMHKIPCGRKVSNNMKKGVLGSWKRCSSENFVRDSKYASKTIRRSRSLTESLDKYSGLLKSISSREPERPPERSQPLRTDNSLDRIFSLPDFDSYIYQMRKMTSTYILDNCFLDDTDNSDELKMVGDYAESDLLLERIIEVDDQLTVHRDMEIIHSTSEQDRDKHSIIPHDYTVQEDLENVKSIEGDIDNDEASMELTVLRSTLNIGVQRKDEAEFNYVQAILQKSGFIGEDYLRELYSPGHPTNSESDKVFDEELLFDLVNEVLLKIYNSSFTYCPLLSHLVSRTRPVPSGSHLLQEVWANISWHLSSQMQEDEAVESLVARHYARNDGWMNLQHEIEIVGLELEDIILDDLLDEVVYQFYKFYHQ
ncbi:hypothetical protein IHE45_09G076400 [Dioscorea alata]|uniref:Uncharacterized protein n=1 Tax=Dioscorea alata TaxID=55571 RepID=A0ACB7VG42_DIOAL|nr:hypothetical protein IHE45_09G076400 [Dioscorea alata]